MIELIWDESFKRKYRKIFGQNEALKKSFWKTVERFTANPFDARLRTHKLSGHLKGLWSFSVAYDCRVIFSFLDEKKILLIDIGGHDEVY